MCSGGTEKEPFMLICMYDTCVRPPNRSYFERMCNKGEEPRSGDAKANNKLSFLLQPRMGIPIPSGAVCACALEEEDEETLGGKDLAAYSSLSLSPCCLD